MSFAISVGELHTYSSGKHRHLPLCKLDGEGCTHIHGEISIEVDGRPLPYLGYFGPDDVCVGAWLAELIAADRVLESGDPAEYVYDEGEQGQPAFVFRREGSMVFVSIVASSISGADGDPEWSRAPCTSEEFRSGVATFVDGIRSALRQNVEPAVAEWWWWRNSGE